MVKLTDGFFYAKGSLTNAQTEQIRHSLRFYRFVPPLYNMLWEQQMQRLRTSSQTGSP